MEINDITRKTFISSLYKKVEKKSKLFFIYILYHIIFISLKFYHLILLLESFVEHNSPESKCRTSSSRFEQSSTSSAFSIY